MRKATLGLAMVGLAASISIGFPASHVYAADPVSPATGLTDQKAPLTSTVDNQAQVALTVYNSNIGLVKDVRDIDLGDGEQQLRFMDVASEIIPTTVHVKSLSDAQALRVLEQNYEYDLISPEKLMEK
ncbi:MAG TPA: hypothetical protein VNN62_13985, partial [Methylomirabilota bacterium]|nr:hypothetical protein [Methylomirabilota bacterium]